MEPGELKRMHEDLLVGLGEAELKAQLANATSDEPARIIMNLWERYIQPLKRRHA